MRAHAARQFFTLHGKRSRCYFNLMDSFRTNKNSVRHFSSDSELRNENLKLKHENAELEQQVEQLKKEVAQGTSKKGGIMGLFQQYGKPFIVWWATLYGLTGVGIYVAIENGVIGGGDAIDWIKYAGLDQYVHVDRLNPAYGNIAAAFVINEACEVIRIPFAAATTAIVAKAWRRRHRVRENSKI